jgi:hypothetical protein
MDLLTTGYEQVNASFITKSLKEDRNIDLLKIIGSGIQPCTQPPAPRNKRSARNSHLILCRVSDTMRRTTLGITCHDYEKEPTPVT